MIKKVIPMTLLILLSMSCFLQKDETNNEILDIQISDTKSEIDEISKVELTEPVKINYNLNILNDNVQFSDLPNLKTISGKYAIVASNKAVFYPYIKLTDNSDLENLLEGEPISIGTIISVDDEVGIENSIHENYFNFQGNNNYFYKTTINNVLGLVWGADLILDLKDVEEIKRVSYYYTKSPKSSKFLAFNGLYNLTNKNLLDIKDNRLSIDSKQLNDDMVSLYQKDGNIRDNTMFITTDLFTTTLNILYKNVKKSTEVKFIHGELIKMVNETLIKIKEYTIEDNKKNEKYTKALLEINNYFLMSKILLNYTDDGEKINELMSSMPIEVKNEYSLITTETGISNSPILSLPQDYSSFSPTAEYQESDILKSYYMTITWFSELNLNNPISLVLGKLFSENEELKVQRDIISKILVYFSGKSTFLGLDDMFLFLEEKDIYNLSYWMENDDNLSKLEVSSNKFKLFSQISSMNTLLSSYGWDTGLEFVEELGSLTARSLLVQSGVDPNKNTKTLDFENSTYMKSFINLLTTIATFEQRDDFYFMEKGKWNQKVLNSTHASWIEYQNSSVNSNDHDYFEMLEENDNLISFRTIDYPDPIHFIEPNKIYFEELLQLILELKEVSTLEQYDIKLNSKLDKTIDMIEEVLEIVDIEINDKALTKKQNSFIQDLPTIIKTITGNIGNNKPGITTINKNIDKNTILEGGVGYPYRIFVALNDNVGGKRIATGYSYSYFEFEHGSDFDLSNSFSNNNIPFWAQDYIK